MRIVMAFVAALLMLSPLSAGFTGSAEAASFKTKYSSIERVPADFKNTQKSGNLEIVIDLSEQRMYVKRTGKRTLKWVISSGAKGYETPKGSYRPTRIYERYFSKTYDDAPMHWAVFFHGGYAIHQTGSYLAMGSPASHGCIRLTPFNAGRLFKMVQAYGKSRTKIIVQA